MALIESLALALLPLLAPLEQRLLFPGAFGKGAWRLPAAVETGLAPGEGPATLEPRPVRLRTADGLELRAALLPAPGGRAPWLVHLHGQGGSVPDYLPLAAGLAGRGLNVLMVEYRGYGGNPGRPGEAGLVRDADAALAWLAARGVPPERTALYGYSLGSGVAVAAAAARPAARQPGALVLEAPYTSVAAVARERFGVPAALLRNRFDTLARAPRVAAPALVLHGRRDRLVPPRQGRAVAAALGGGARFALLPGGHADLVCCPDSEVLDAVAKFVRKATESPVKPVRAP